MMKLVTDVIISKNSDPTWHSGDPGLGRQELDPETVICRVVKGP